MAFSSAHIRQAVEGDLDGLIAADTLAAKGDRSRSAYLEAAVATGICRVADADGIAGYVIVRPGHFFGRDFVDLLMVHQDRRREGIGGLLLGEAASTATSDKVFTSTNRSNVPMTSLLASEGWAFSGELVGLDDDDPELVFYALTRTATLVR